MKGKMSLIKKARTIFIQLKEGVAFTLNELKNNKFRTFLSLLGVSIGIFTIVSIFTAVDALKSNAKKGFESLSSNMMQISQWPMGPEDEDGNVVLDMRGGMMEYRWWDYMKRPPITINDYKYLKANSKLSEEVVFSYSGIGTIKYGRHTASGVDVLCSTDGLSLLLKIDIVRGRMITKSEFENGTSVVILGNDLAESLFAGEDPIGKSVKINGFSFMVVGVTEKQGESIVTVVETDNIAIITYIAGKGIFYLREPEGQLHAIPKADIDQETFKRELTQLMRQYRRIRPEQKNNFSINEYSVLEDILEGLLGVIRTVGWVIAAFSLLIGGFGIANIMFVSVRERTKIIGIQKALGAKKYFIMTQFLVEALVLAIAGALVGILLIALILWIVPIPAEYDVHLTLENIIAGAAIASAIGLLSGLLPAWKAAGLNPVDAINTK